MKVCTKCKVEKDFGEFDKRPDIKNGLKSHCKDCIKEYVKEYRKNNREKAVEYRKKNREKLAKQHRKYRENNREKIVERGRKYRENNREKIKEYRKKYEQNNKERITARHRKWCEENKEKIAEYYQNNKERIFENKKNNPFTTQSSVLSNKARTRAREKNIPIDLDFISTPNITNWLKHQLRCECCNVEFDIGFKNGKEGGKSNSPSLDRFDPEKGYVKGNVYLICFECNSLKRDANSKRLEMVVNWMKRKEAENKLISTNFLSFKGGTDITKKYLT